MTDGWGSEDDWDGWGEGQGGQESQGTSDEPQSMHPLGEQPLRPPLSPLVPRSLMTPPQEGDTNDAAVGTPSARDRKGGQYKPQKRQRRAAGGWPVVLIETTARTSEPLEPVDQQQDEESHESPANVTVFTEPPGTHLLDGKFYKKSTVAPTHTYDIQWVAQNITCKSLGDTRF
jgi:hypothetical protein